MPKSRPRIFAGLEQLIMSVREYFNAFSIITQPPAKETNEIDPMDPTNDQLIPFHFFTLLRTSVLWFFLFFSHDFFFFLVLFVCLLPWLNHGCLLRQ